jgi:hypothetical protein
MNNPTCHIIGNNKKNLIISQLLPLSDNTEHSQMMIAMDMGYENNF